MTNKFVFSGHESFSCKSLWLKKVFRYSLALKPFCDESPKISHIALTSLIALCKRECFFSVAASEAFQNTLGNEWAGDSLLLARENLLYTFTEYFAHRFGHQPTKEWLRIIADIISWNIAQMDGLKLVVPDTCHDVVTTNLLGEKEVHPCPGCKARDARKHNGIPVLVKSWSTGLAVPLRMCLKNNRK